MLLQALAVVASVAACGGTDGLDVFASAPGGGSQAGQISCSASSGQLSVGGTWAVHARLPMTFQQAPDPGLVICPHNQLGDADVLMMLEVTQDASDASKLQKVQPTLCALDLPNIKAAVLDCSSASIDTDIMVPDTLAAAFAKLPVGAVAGDIGDALPGGDFSIDRFSLLAGTSKQGDAMPSWSIGGACNDPGAGAGATCSTSCVADCSALRDDDGDQYPGVTVDLCGKTQSDITSGNTCHTETPSEPGATLQGRAFIGLEMDPQIAGTAVSSCEMHGTMDTSFRVNVVGADLYLAGLPVPVSTFVGSLPVFTIDAPTSAVHMVRVDGQYGAPNLHVDPADVGGACAAILANREQL